MVDVTVKIDNAKLENQIKKIEIALKKTGEALHTEIVQSTRTPRGETGNLQNESCFVNDDDLKNGKIKIVWNTPYARRLYFHPEYNFRKDKNPLAQGHWAEPWITGSKKEFALKAMEMFLKGEF